jgi:hypothetical protein
MSMSFQDAATSKAQPRSSNAVFIATLLAALLSFPALVAAQAQRGTLVHEESIRVSPSSDAAKLGEAGRGHELVIIESGHDWTHVEAILREPRKDADEDDPESEGKTITGWVSSKALVNQGTPNGDKIVFGEAADSEDQASRRRGRRDAAQDAMRLYYRVYDLFPHLRRRLKDCTAPQTFGGRWSGPTCSRGRQPANAMPTCAARSTKSG